MQNIKNWFRCEKICSCCKNKKVVLKIIIGLVIAILIFGGGYWAGNRKNSTQVINKIVNKDIAPKTEIKDLDFKLFWEAWDLLEKNYVDQPISEKDLFYGAISGLVNSLNDPHSVFLNPEKTAEFNREMNGEFEGIGAELGIRADRITIISPLPNTPAKKAGLQPQDQILAIDKIDTTGMSLDEAVNRIRGEGGTNVVLTILRKGETEFREVTITRAKIVVPSLTWEMKNNQIAYIEVANFNSDAIEAFDKAAREILLKNPKGIILDLRNNPGGFFNASISIADYWIDNGVIVKEVFSDKTEKAYSATEATPFGNIPTVILVNGGSASASEIVSGALQDNKLATIIGEKTYGKGSVQSLNYLKDGSSIKLTIAKWLTPNGNQINGIGITPDVVIEMKSEDYENYLDPQMDKAFEILNEKIINQK
ncbi:MAG: S41 family peptidase [Patescibacteria group bacterium]